MADWVTPIYDRTQSDIDNAIRQIKDWETKGFTIVTELKGCLNVSDINRIENNIQFLSDNLSSLYYFLHTVSKSWGNDGLPNIEDVSRIIGNIKKIISAFFQYGSAPNLPETMLTYQHINDMEENLYLLKNMITDMKSHYKECGNFTCGEG